MRLKILHLLQSAIHCLALLGQCREVSINDPQGFDYATLKNVSISNDEYGAKMLEFRAFGQHFLLRLFPSADLLKHLWRRYNKGSTAQQRVCHYQGRVISHGNASVAMSICPSLRGIIALDTQFLVIHPKWENSTVYAENHVIYKRQASLGQYDGDEERFQLIEETVFHQVKAEHFCDVDVSIDDMPPTVQHDFIDSSLPPAITLELAVFADDKLWQTFKQLHADDAETELQDYVMSFINNVDLLYRQPSIKPIMKIEVVHFEIWKTSPEALRSEVHKHGEAQLMLDSFCQHQWKLKGDWDHATLLTGYDIYHTTSSVAGVAPVARMCDAHFSCSLIEGNHLGRSFVMAHEVGHNLGMLHDGMQNQCSQTCCLMSSYNGAGRTMWSPCSVREYRSFLRSISRSGSSIKNCLTTEASSSSMSNSATLKLSKQNFLPGQRYTADAQCQFFWGKDYRLDIPSGKSRADVCHVLWCSSGGATISSAHPALDGTWCGGNRWCKHGKCLEWSKEESPSAVDGQWSAWSSMKRGLCSDCVIKGAIRLRKEIRSCSAPSPNNGGQECLGSSVRGTLCVGSFHCDNMTKSAFADRICTSIRDDPIKADKQLSGSSFLHDSAPCKIWCHLENTLMIRSKGNYPDGTPCGFKRYCLSGECLRQLCHDDSVVSTPSDCPMIQGEFVSSPASHWSSWSSWSVCSTSCGIGKRLRSRTCTALGKCSSSSEEESSVCDLQPCHSTWTSWTAWSECSSSCGDGIRLRTRNCSQPDGLCYGKPLEIDRCQGSCNDVWTPWAPWTPCSASCGIGVRRRYRQCIGSGSCKDFGQEIVLCDDQPCAVSSWSEWSACTAVCAGKTGFQGRRRNCPTQSNSCNSTELRSCQSDQPCTAQWTSWNSWTSCSSSCGNGTKSRNRQCSDQAPSDLSEFGRSCPGKSVDVRPCESFQCFSDRPSWSPWTVCSTTCGEGVKTRWWRCPNDSSSCDTYAQNVSCNHAPCPQATPQFGAWHAWSACTSSCGSSHRSRVRDCELDSQTPCPKESLTETEPCPNVPCDLGSTWSHWSPWTTCSANCGGGRQSRRRNCLSSSPSFDECVGFSIEEQSCNAHLCNDSHTSVAHLSLPQWSSWFPWSQCSCYTATRIRHRLCRVENLQSKGFCMGESYQEGACSPMSCEPVDGGWSSWTDWSSCNAAERARFRLCANPTPSNGGANCPEEGVEVKRCSSDKTSALASVGVWSAWTTWSSCFGTVCNRRVSRRTRYCQSGSDGQDSYGCVGVDLENKECVETVDCSTLPPSQWSKWSSWSECSATCGNSVRQRSRQCQLPPPSYGVQYWRNGCFGQALEVIVCHGPPCPHARWSEWSAWTKCSSLCASGIRQRRRDCVGASSDCLGASRDVAQCSSDKSDKALCLSTAANHELLMISTRDWESKNAV